jgi:hypothetical protein
MNRDFHFENDDGPGGELFLLDPLPLMYDTHKISHSTYPTLCRLAQVVTGLNVPLTYNIARWQPERRDYTASREEHLAAHACNTVSRCQVLKPECTAGRETGLWPLPYMADTVVRR